MEADFAARRAAAKRQREQERLSAATYRRSLNDVMRREWNHAKAANFQASLKQHEAAKTPDVDETPRRLPGAPQGLPSNTRWKGRDRALPGAKGVLK